MIELEIQALALQREGLLVEVGKLAGECGFTLLRQRQVPDSHGTLLSMVVRGAWLKKRALRLALERCDRLVSFQIAPAVEGELRAHFAATRRVTSGYQPPPAPVSVVRAEQEVATPDRLADGDGHGEAVVAPVFEPEPAPELFEALLVRSPAPSPLPPEPEPEPYVESPELAADEAAVGQIIARLEQEYPRVVPALLALGRAVAPGARESSLRLAGLRIGAWLFARDYAKETGLALDMALDKLALPALQAYAEASLHGSQLHLRDSAMCVAGGLSGCSYYCGFLEGLLQPAMARRAVSIFPVCCASFGATECVLAVSE